MDDSKDSGPLGTVVRSWADTLGQKRSEVLSIVDAETSILIQLAIDAADMADRARISDDRLYLAAATRLQQLIRAVNHDGNTGDSTGDAWAQELAGIMGAAPGMGNTA